MGGGGRGLGPRSEPKVARAWHETGVRARGRVRGEGGEGVSAYRQRGSGSPPLSLGCIPTIEETEKERDRKSEVGGLSEGLLPRPPTPPPSAHDPQIFNPGCPPRNARGPRNIGNKLTENLKI